MLINYPDDKGNYKSTYNNGNNNDADDEKVHDGDNEDN